MRKSTLAAAALAALAAATAPVLAGDDVLRAPGAASDLPGKAFAMAGSMQGADTQAIATRLATDAVRQWLPGLGDDAPDWAKRIEFQWQMDEFSKPEYSVLTVQPLYQSENKQDTLFVQASQLRYAMFGDYRDTSNLGLGYRRLFLNDKLLVGVNSFYDREWTYDHQRMSYGGEVKFASLDFGANRYLALSDRKTVSTGILEQALDGWDAELRSQLPYLPWARVGAKYFRWEKDQASDDTKGWTYGIEMDVTQNVQLEIAWTDDNHNDNKALAAVRFRLGGGDKPTLLSDRIVDDHAFVMRDMKGHTLDKVRRQNKIVVERSSSAGIAVGRGN